MKQKGDLGELLAIQYLQKHQYRICDTNYKFGRFGEVDIIAQLGCMYVFIEVKYRASDQYGTAKESIIKSKLSKCKKTVESYCLRHRIDYENIQFDVITIEKLSKSHRLTHYKNIEI